MHKTHAKRRRDIKTKLMAAICMLLVSSIMMVSTTYAWFTLSTAPEVTGINTAVGANGNLEMALVPTGGIDAIEASAVGDAGISLDARNVTWGNLVDLSYAVDNTNYYGLDKIQLYPAALNTTENGNLADLMLKTPTYGADGRVSELVANAVASIYDFATKSFPQTAGYGVRAVGTASGMTDRQLAYRNARSAANTAMSMAKTMASQSLNTNGASLANIALAHAVDANSTHTQTDVQNLLAIVNDLLGTDEKTGILEYIENAYRSYIIALGASAANAPTSDNPDNGMTDDEFKAFESAINAAADLSAVKTLLTNNGVSLNTTISDAIDALIDTQASVKNAKNELSAITAEDGITWATLSTPLSKLADTGAMKLNGYEASSVKENMSAIINQVASQGLTVSIATGGGVYADVADHCGDFTAAITIAQVEYNGLVLENMNARMKTATTVNPTYLTLLSEATGVAGAPSGAGGQTMPISDFYGYIVDLAFRTNAADSNLLLQTEAVDRIYGENGTEETMGHGASMTFTSTTTDFTVDQMVNLLKSIRVVFFDPNNANKILGTAKLDLTEGQYTVVGGNTITAYLYLYEATGATVTYSEATAEQKADETTTLYTKDADAETYTAVADRTQLADDVTYYVKVENTAGEQKLTGTDAVITALTQNTATAVSVLVYLDGETITNADVAATASSSMTGTMNLQFSSSANLVPMEYTPLMNQGGTNNDAGNGEVTPEGGEEAGNENNGEGNT